MCNNDYDNEDYYDIVIMINAQKTILNNNRKTRFLIPFLDPSFTLFSLRYSRADNTSNCTLHNKENLNVKKEKEKARKYKNFQYTCLFTTLLHSFYY